MDLCFGGGSRGVHILGLGMLDVGSVLKDGHGRWISFVAYPDRWFNLVDSRVLAGRSGPVVGLLCSTRVVPSR